MDASAENYPLVQKALLPGEQVRFLTQPIRPSYGIGIWMFMALGLAFTWASAGGLADAIDAGSVAGGILAALLLAVSIVWLAVPWLAYRALRTTFVVVTDRAVLRVTKRKTVRHDKADITGPRIIRRRGKSASVLLHERMIEKSDGSPSYRYVSVDGLPDAESVLAAVLTLKSS